LETVVEGEMLAVGEEFEVLGPVVVLVAVDVMDEQLPVERADGVPHDPAVLQDVAFSERKGVVRDSPTEIGVAGD
jgi:hypothetical protein